MVPAGMCNHKISSTSVAAAQVVHVASPRNVAEVLPWPLQSVYLCAELRHGLGGKWRYVIACMRGAGQIL